LYGVLMSAWAPLPTAGELVRLALPCPPQLVELVGYDGLGRLVALWWSPFGDGLMFSDGTLTATGNRRGWLCFCEHPLVQVFLEDYQLGDSEDEAEHWLLVDRYFGTLDVGLARDVKALLATQPSELCALTADLSPSVAQVLLERARDAHIERERKRAQERQAQVRSWREREQELLEQLTALLDDAQRAACELDVSRGTIYRALRT
jgi:hypothetical protein